MLTSTELLTFDEIAAFARLSAAEAPPYVPDDDALVEAGTRSLLARRFLTVDPDDRTLRVAGDIADAAGALGSSRRFLVLARAGAGDGDRHGRVVLVEQGPALVEEVVAPGIVAITPIETSLVPAFLHGVFGLEAGPAASEPARHQVVTAVLTEATDPSPTSPISAPGWTSPVLNSVMCLDADRAPALVQWVDESSSGGRLWLLLAGDPTATETAIPARRVDGGEIRRLLEGALHDVLGIVAEASAPTGAGE